jgi:hypothetical protein
MGHASYRTLDELSLRTEPSKSISNKQSLFDWPDRSLKFFPCGLYPLAVSISIHHHVHWPEPNAVACRCDNLICVKQTAKAKGTEAVT